MTTAGRVLRISPPSERSNETHQTSPLRIAGIPDQPLRPVLRLRLPGAVPGHRPVALGELVAAALAQALHLLEHRLLEVVRDDEPGRVTSRLRIPHAVFAVLAVPTDADGLVSLPVHLRYRPFAGPLAVEQVNPSDGALGRNHLLRIDIRHEAPPD